MPVKGEQEAIDMRRCKQQVFRNASDKDGESSILAPRHGPWRLGASRSSRREVATDCGEHGEHHRSGLFSLGR